MSETAFPAAVMTDQLIGRREQLETINAQIFAPDLGTSFRCVLVQANGGKGKTRLLREIERLSLTGGDGASAPILLPLVDLADPALHTEVAFLRTIGRALRDRLVPGHLSSQLRGFEQALASYESARDNMAAFQEVTARRKALREAFRQAYSVVTANFRVVWVLDTMEQLFATPDELEDLMRFELRTDPVEIGPSTYNWLLNFIYGRPVNTTMVLAGRPHGPWAEKIHDAITFLDAILSLSEDAQPAGQPSPAEDGSSIIKPLNVEDFTPAELEEYLAALRRQLSASGQEHIVENLNWLIDREGQREVLSKLTEGNPIRLALYTDLLVNSAQIPAAFRLSLAQLDQKTADELLALRSAIETSLLEHIASKLGEESGQVLEYLSVMRRGLDGARLAALWRCDRGTADEALHRVSQLSFVKRRAESFADEHDEAPLELRYFLHDELYQIYQEAFARATPEEQLERRYAQRDIFERLIETCRDELRRLNRSILEQQHRPVRQQEEGGVNERLADQRARRRQLLAEILHYSLYLDPEAGFAKTYFDFTERAFATNDLELAGQLQSEVDHFFFGQRPELNRIQTECSLERWQYLCFAVLHERIGNWIRRLTKANSYDEIPKFTADAIRDHEPMVRVHYPELADLYEQPAGQLLRALARWEWEALAIFAEVYGAGPQVEQVIERLKGLIGKFEAVLRGRPVDDLPAATAELLPPRFRTRLINVLAMGYMYAGYGRVTQNSYLRAAEYYQTAAAILRRADWHLVVLQAELMNNLSRAMGEIGEFNRAIFYCDEGTRLHEELGLDYRMAISYNTKALIYNLHQMPLAASGFAQRALILLRRLNEPRAIGLALIQAGEAYRRRWGAQADQQTRSGLNSTEPEHGLIDEARAYLLEAEEIFTEKVPDQLRLTEAQAALACLSRDWANYNREQPGHTNFELAKTYFDTVLKRTRPTPDSRGFTRQYLATLLDKAWLYKRARLLEPTRELEALASAVVPQELCLRPEAPLDVETARRDVAFLRELSKLEALRCDMAALRGDDVAVQLRHRILATVYLQLFNADDWYLGMNLRKLYTLVSEAWRQDRAVGGRLLATAEQVIATYHLEALEQLPIQPPVGRLQFRQVLHDVLAPPTEIDYI